MIPQRDRLFAPAGLGRLWLLTLAWTLAPAPWRSEAAAEEAAAARKSPDPLAGTPKIKPEQTGQSAEQILARLARPRTDSWADWVAPLEPLHYCGEPRALAPCVPPPPCHPSQPPAPYDLVGVRGEPTCGPIYDGPCAPRTGTHDDGPHPRLHRAHDRFFDWFYMWK
ncbi:MAG: hypothetical protein RLZZ111_1387 [Planctomycetota bacterium]|jgi:hypothetical protein